MICLFLDLTIWQLLRNMFYFFQGSGSGKSQSWREEGHLGLWLRVQNLRGTFRGRITTLLFVCVFSWPYTGQKDRTFRVFRWFGEDLFQKKWGLQLLGTELFCKYLIQIYTKVNGKIVVFACRFPFGDIFFVVLILEAILALQDLWLHWLLQASASCSPSGRAVQQ